MRRLVLTLGALAAVATPGCRSREAQQVVGAMESFIDFGMSNEERPLEPREKAAQRPHLLERSRKLLTKVRGGPKLQVEVDLPHHLEAKAVDAALSIELDRLLDEASYPMVELTGRPAGLLRFGGAMGRATVRRRADGEVRRRVKVLVRDSQPPLTDDQYEALVELELALARAGRGNAAAAKREIRQRYGAELVDSAVKVARRRFGRR